MNTWRLLALLAVVLSLFSIVALEWRPVEHLHNRVPLVWVSDNNPARSEQIGIFNRENPQYRLGLDYSNSGKEKILLQCSSGVGPDIFDFYDRAELQIYAEAGVLWDVTAEAEKRGFAPNAKSWHGLASEVMYRGRQYGFPCNIGTSLIVYNKNVFDYYGVAYPTKIETWDQLIQLARKVSTAGTGKSGVDGPIYGISGLSWPFFLASERGEYFDPAGRVFIAGNPALKRAFEYHRDVIFKHKLTLTSVELSAMGGQGGWGAGDFTRFETNHYAMIITGEYSLIEFGRTYAAQIKELEKSGQKPDAIKDPMQRPLRLGSFLLPGFPGHDTCYELGSRMAGINSYSPHRQEALAFLQYLSGPSYSASLNRGRDNLPGNAIYAYLGAATGTDDLSTAQLHDDSVRAMPFGYVKRESPFLLKGEVSDVLGAEISRLESDPGLDIDLLLQDAQRQLDRLLKRNLDHDAALRKLYDQTGRQSAALVPGAPK